MSESAETNPFNLNDLQDNLKHTLKKKRYQHTLGVRYTAQAMAMCFGADIFDAGLSGLLHDCAKYLSDEEMLTVCKENKIEISDAELKAPSLLHAKLGAYFACAEYGVKKEEVLSAIRWHTTGKPEMTMLEKIVFIADYIEPGRKEVSDMSLIRKQAFVNLDRTMALILQNTIRYLESKPKTGVMDPHSLEAFSYYQKFL